MKCPAEIQPIIAQIIQLGILRVRSAAWSGDSDRCAIEADHIHNLPSLLMEYHATALKYYWDAERPDFIRQCAADSLEAFAPLWDSLQQYAELPAQSTTSQ